MPRIEAAAKPTCEAQTQLCSGELIQRYGVNGSARKGETFAICGACAVYLKRGGNKLTAAPQRVAARGEASR